VSVSINRVIISGHLCFDPELTTLASGRVVTNLRVAVDDREVAGERRHTAIGAQDRCGARAVPERARQRGRWEAAACGGAIRASRASRAHCWLR